MSAPGAVVTNDVARSLCALVEPIHAVAYQSDEPTEELKALGLRNYWDGYFAGRAAPLGTASAEVVDAVFYSFAPGEVARHIPRVWHATTPEAALAARERGCVAALRRILGDLAASPAVARAADLALKAVAAAPTDGRVLSTALRTLAVPGEPVARLWHAATVLREHRGDGHNASLLAAGIDRTECHVLLALEAGTPAHEFGRLSHLPTQQVTAVIDRLHARGLVDDSGWLSEAGHEVKRWVEDRTDALAAPAYEGLTPAELDQLVTDLTPIASRLDQCGSR